MEKIVAASGGAVGVALVVSILIALNGASGAFGASGRALNRIYAVEDDRGFVDKKLTDIGVTLALVVLLLVVIGALFLGGGYTEDLFGSIGLGHTAAVIWSIVRWPLALGGMLVAYALIYAFAPDIEPRRIRWITPGAVTGVGVWIVASIAVRHLHQELLVLRRGLRRRGRGHRVVVVVVAVVLRVPVRRRAERRAGTGRGRGPRRPAAAGRRGRRARPSPRASRAASGPPGARRARGGRGT